MFRDWDEEEEFDLDAIQARQEALEAELAWEEELKRQEAAERKAAETADREAPEAPERQKTEMSDRQEMRKSDRQEMKMPVREKTPGREALEAPGSKNAEVSNRKTTEASDRRKTEAGAEPGAGTELEAGAEPGAGAETGVGAELEAGAEPGAGAELEAGAEPRAGAETGVGAEPEAGAETGVGAEPEAEAETEDTADTDHKVGLDVTKVLVMEDYTEPAAPAETVKPAGPVYQAGEWESIVEAVLFTMGKPVATDQLAAAIGQPGEIAGKVAERLAEKYDRENRGMQIIRLEDSFQMCTRGRYYENLILVASAPKRHTLTEVALETLSIIAYKQPVTRMEIEKIRGVNSDHAVNRLIEYNLVQEIGRLDAPGRPALFATTEEFLRRFGIGSKENLPAMDPVREEEIRSEVEEELQVDLEELEQEAENAGSDPAEE